MSGAQMMPQAPPQGAPMPQPAAGNPAAAATAGMGGGANDPMKAEAQAVVQQLLQFIAKIKQRPGIDQAKLTQGINQLIPALKTIGEAVNAST